MRAILAARAEPLVVAAREAVAAPDPGAAFFGFVRRLFSASGDFRALADSLAAAGLDIDSAKEAVGVDLMRAVGQLFARAQRAGDVRPDVTIEDLHLLIGGLSHCAQGATDQRQVARCVELLCDAVRSPLSASATQR
jgi:hypothetical protein